MTENVDQIIEVDQETTIDRMIDKTISGMMIGETITDKIIEGKTTEVTIDKTMDKIIIGNRSIEIEVQVGTTAGVVTEII